MKTIRTQELRIFFSSQQFWQQQSGTANESHLHVDKGTENVPSMTNDAQMALYQYKLSKVHSSFSVCVYLWQP